VIGFFCFLITTRDWSHYLRRYESADYF
jgi:hypothetical protein